MIMILLIKKNCHWSFKGALVAPLTCFIVVTKWMIIVDLSYFFYTCSYYAVRYDMLIPYTDFTKLKHVSCESNILGN